MRTAWSRALFGVAPSRWPEPLGNVVHEGMRAGKAVIGTHPGGHREMIRDSQTGLIVRGGRPDELASAMVRLLENPGECRKMGDAAKLAASKYTADALWPQFQAFYTAVLEHAGRRSHSLRG